MILGVMSDTHGNFELMQRAVDIMISQYNVAAIIHLGDDLADLEHVKFGNIASYGVPGIYEGLWHDSKVPRRTISQFDGLKFFLSHTPELSSKDGPNDMNPTLAHSKYGAQVLLYGHTHQYASEKMGDGLIRINPGHLKSDIDRGSPASFAIIEIDRPKMGVKIVGLDGEILLENDYTAT